MNLGSGACIIKNVLFCLLATLLLSNLFLEWILFVTWVWRDLAAKELTAVLREDILL